jgi:hypothetical protein
MASTALWRPTSSTNQSSSPVFENSAQPCTEPAWEHDLVDLVHQAAEHRALAAAGGDDLPGGALFDVGDAVAGHDGDRVHRPVDLDRDDVLDRPHQALVAQVAERKQLRRAAQRHQGDQLTLVDVDRERTLGRDVNA